MSITFSFEPPEANEFIKLRESIGWHSPNLNVVQVSITNTLFWICGYSNERLICCARVIGDGSMYFYIQDVIVDIQKQHQGLGNKMMEHIELFIEDHCPSGATVGLLSAHGKEDFYARYGYSKRDGETLGLALCKFL